MFRKNECEIIAQMLWDYADQSLDFADIDRVEVHLAGCEPCRLEAEGFQSTASMVDVAKAMPIPESRMTWMELRATLENENRSVSTTGRPIWKSIPAWKIGPAWSMALAGAFVGLVVFKMMSADDAGQLPTISKSGPTQSNSYGTPSPGISPSVSGPKAATAPPVVALDNDRGTGENRRQDNNRPETQIRNSPKPQLTMAHMTAAPTTLSSPTAKINQAFERGVLDGDRPAASKHNFVITPAAYPDNSGPDRNYVIGSIVNTHGSGGQGSQGGEESQVW